MSYSTCLTRIASFAAAVALLQVGLFAQGAGRLSGLVLDPAQAAVPNARVVAENLDAAVRREAVSGELGQFLVPDLPIGTYRLTVTAPGFQARTLTGLTLTVGSTVNVAVALVVGQVSESVEVSADTPVLDPEAPSGAVMTNKPLVELPINGRDYGRFTLLTPGAVTRSSFIGDISFNGLHASHNSFSIDGVDASRVDQPFMSNGFERGARLMTGSLDTIAEFRVQTANYRAEYGRAAGSIVTIATRSGTNHFHGAAYHFFRNDRLDARNFFNAVPQPKASFRYNNFGANLGGPVWRDRTFFFANYEGSRQRLGVIGSGTVPSQAMREQTLAASPVLQPLLAAFPLGTARTANALIDSYSISKSLAVTEDTGSVRVDHNLSAKDRIFGRYNRAETEVLGPLFSVLASALGVNDFQSVPSNTRNGVLNWQRVQSARLLVDVTAGVQRTLTAGDSDLPIPVIAVTGVTASPGSRRKQRVNATLYQLGGSLTHSRGAHTIKTGATGFHSTVNSLTTNMTTLTYLSLQDFIANRLTQASLNSGNPGSGLRQTHGGLYVQDTWRAARQLTIDAGLRYDLTTPNYDVQRKMRPFDATTGQLAAPGTAFYRWNPANFGPRLALAWMPRPNFAIRTGYGIFYQQYAAGFGGSVPLNSVPGNTVLTRQLIPTLAWPLESFLGSGTQAAPSVAGFDVNRPDTYAQQWNFTLQGQLPAAVAVSAAYVGNRGINLRRTGNINFIDPALGRRPYPQFSQVNIEYNDSQSSYHGLQLSASRQQSKGLFLSWNYTWAKAIDDVQDYGGQFSTQIQDPACRRCERARASTDIRHTMNFQALYALPFGKGLLGGWQIAALGVVRSGLAVNVTMPQNTFGSDNLTNQRPDLIPGVPLRAANPSPDGWLNPAAFRVPARGSYGSAGRNILTGPGFTQLDASVKKEFPLRESVRLQLRGEVFNFLNHPVFVPPNTSFGTANFGRIFNTFGRTIGSGTSRQIQLALRLSF